MWLFRRPIIHELLDTGVEQELAFVFVPAKKFGTSWRFGRIGRFRLVDLEIGGLSVIIEIRIYSIIIDGAKTMKNLFC